CMPNTTPPLDTPERVADVVARAKGLPARIYPIGAISIGRKGEALADLDGMAAAGAIGFSDDGDSTRSSLVMRRALEWSARGGRPIMVHCEDWTLLDGGVMHEGAVSRELGLPGIPAAAEEIILARDIELARLTGGWLHALHVSTARGRDLVRAAKREGLRVTAEVMPHHLLMTDEWVAGRRRFVGSLEEVPGPRPDPNAKVNPPLRTEADARALLEGLRDGTFDIVATDHAPHATEDKPGDLRRAAFGMIGLEFALPLMLQLVARSEIGLSRMVEWLSTAPAALLGLPGGTLRPGAVADVVLFDPESVWTVTEASIVSKSKNTPLLGMTLRGAVTLTLVGGEVRYRAMP
ncbi:MAG: dihydroorotase, partial [Thermomicrobiaceae bacterium]|nr:dihydroorotase [Thermomicrobiaceae bacterium]